MTGKALMIQGTGSDVGKSVLTAALCRLFVREGYRVAPFKAQNMALNSFVTIDGGEIGRAQAVQAAAARAEPSVHMNPVLLKPREDTSAQVIVHGFPVGNQDAREYIKYKKSLIPKVRESLEYLKNNYDLVVIEGAGSPAEINLREHDLVNMATAIEAQAPVLLAADIDRGGVFASVVGTLALLEDYEKEMIKGVIINKFRGQVERLRPGLEQLEGLIDKPVIGVIPYFSDFRVPEEDTYLPREKSGREGEKNVEIVVIHLPHISNFTDFDPLEEVEGVYLRYAVNPEDLGYSDAIIIPGSKNTIEDLDNLWEQGWAQKIIDFSQGGGTVIGICGGYQMLGQEIVDSKGSESKINRIQGLGLLNIKTEFFSEKITCQAKGKVIETSEEVMGYEIHMGKTTLLSGSQPLLEIKQWGREKVNKLDGAVRDDGLVFGTYLHGLFDQVPFRVRFINNLRNKKGLPLLKEEEQLSQFEVWERSYEKLANLVSQNIQMDYIYNLVFK